MTIQRAGNSYKGDDHTGDSTKYSEGCQVLRGIQVYVYKYESINTVSATKDP